MFTPDQIYELSTTLSVFCDASIDIKNKIACGGAVSSYPVFGANGSNVLVDNSRMTIQRCATNNSGEILAILEGINLASIMMQYIKFNRINIYSDSKISLYGLREWCFRWAPTQDENGFIYGSNGKVSNQQKFIEIIDTIINLKLPVRFYHQKGHVKKTQYAMANRFFYDANKEFAQVVNPLYDIETISAYNNWIDKATREQCLFNVNAKTFSYDKSDPEYNYSSPIQDSPSSYDTRRIIHPLQFQMTPERMLNYKSLIGMNNITPDGRPKF